MNKNKLLSRRQALRDIGLATAMGAGALAGLAPTKTAKAGGPPEDIFLLGDSFRVGGYQRDINGDLVLDMFDNPIYEPEKGWQYHLEMLAPEFNFLSLLNSYGDPEPSNGTPYLLNHIDDIVAAYPPAPGKKMIIATGLWDASIYVLNTPLSVYTSRINDITNQLKNTHGYDVRWLATTGVDNRVFPVTAARVAWQNEALHEMGDALDVPVHTTMYLQRRGNWQWDYGGAHFDVPGFAKMAQSIYDWIEDW